MLIALKRFVSNPDAGRLALRFFFFGILFLEHGLPKLFNFNGELVGYPHVFGLNPVVTLLFATMSDGICSVLIVLGVCTRWAALYCFCTLVTGWGWVDHFRLITSGRNGIGLFEILPMYIIGAVAVFMLGPGRYSIDWLLAKGAEKRQFASTHVAASK